MSQELVKSYQVVSEDGEIQNKFLYFPGQPKDYRFDARNGNFKIGEHNTIMDGSRPATSFTFQPFAFRKGTGILFGRDRAEKWIELFFVDSKNCASAILFNSTNVEPFEDFMLQECLYEGLAITDFQITLTPKEVVSKKDPQKKWFVCQVGGKRTDKSLVKQLSDFDKDFKVFREASAKFDFEFSMIKSSYYEEVVKEQEYIDAPVEQAKLSQ